MWLPNRAGRTAIPTPEEMVESCECSHLIDSLKGREMYDDVCHKFYDSSSCRDESGEGQKSEKVLVWLLSGMDKLGARLDYLKEKEMGI